MLHPAYVAGKGGEGATPITPAWPSGIVGQAALVVAVPWVVAVTVGVAAFFGVVVAVTVTVTFGDAVVNVQPATRPMAMTIGTMTLTVPMTRLARDRGNTMSVT
jgi:ABC-type enterochelin transport system permease subunit